MRVLFISNAPISPPDGGLGEHELVRSVSPIDQSFDIEDLSAEAAEGDTVFVLDVHCTSKKLGDQAIERSEQHGGVMIYRHLLGEFKNLQENLKVVFYSPISRDELVALDPASYVLKLLPFVEWNNDELFATRLTEEIDRHIETGWLQVNNAAENLLSGWALAKKKAIRARKDHDAKIALHELKLLVVDDELREWQPIYSTIFDLSMGNIQFTPHTSQSEFRAEWRAGTVHDSIGAMAEDTDAILSDLYLYENHEETPPYKSQADIEKISGFKLFKFFKENYPYLPYLMFTSSNKVWNVDAFRSSGIWAWAVKENSITASLDDKKAQYEHFEACINKLASAEWRLVAQVWKEFLLLQQSPVANTWWFGKYPHALDIINDCLLVLDTVYSQRAMFEIRFIGQFEGRLCFQLFNNLGGLCEELDLHPKNDEQRCILVGSYIYQLRNFFSHKLFYSFARPIEALLCVHLFIRLLELSPAQYEALPQDARIKIDKEFVDHTNLNYFLQFEAAAPTKCGFAYETVLTDAVRRSFAGITTNIISAHYTSEIMANKLRVGSAERQIEKNQAVIDLIEGYVKGTP
jgi:hypothetical protein